MSCQYFSEELRVQWLLPVVAGYTTLYLPFEVPPALNRSALRQAATVQARPTLILGNYC